MKKFSIAIFAFVYFAISSGMIVNLHYCMNSFASADFNPVTTTKSCNTCGMDKEKSHGCCHDEIKLVKLQDDQNRTSAVAYEFASFQPVTTFPSTFITASFYNAGPVGEYLRHSPPILVPDDLQVRNCVFRI